MPELANQHCGPVFVLKMRRDGQRLKDREAHVHGAIYIGGQVTCSLDKILFNAGTTGFGSPNKKHP